MAQNTFEAFPPCCQKILVDLAREQRKGTRNCEAGHQVSLAYAEQLEKQGPKKPVSTPAH
ncbi:MAG: hypothetical protein ACYC8T_22705 [Myxococcaceae bacterium]